MAQRNPLVSVVLPVYNMANYVSDAVRSILKQTYTNIELIIIDDGSTDELLKTLEYFDDERIKIRRFAANRGLVYALNYGFGIAQGEYIARMDADDISFPRRLEKQIEFMERNPEVGVCGTSILIKYTRQRYKIHIPYPTTHEKIRISLRLHSNFVCHPTTVIRAAIMKNGIRYQSEYKHAEDYKLWVQLVEHTKLANLKEPFLMKRVHSEQVSSKHTAIQKVTAHKILAEQFTTTGSLSDADQWTLEILSPASSKMMTSGEKLK